MVNPEICIDLRYIKIWNITLQLIDFLWKTLLMINSQLWASYNFLGWLFLESSENSYFGIFLLVIKQVHLLLKWFFFDPFVSLGNMFKFQTFCENYSLNYGIRDFNEDISCN